MAKLLTIIIPSYNVSAYLRNGCESLNLPEYHDCLEILIVNDGSKDDTSEIGHEFERRYSDVYRVIDKSNGNYGSCINRGLLEAKGTFVKIMDGDDSFDRAGFAKLLDTLKAVADENSQVDVVLSNADCIDEDGHRTPYCVTLGEHLAVPINRSFSIDDVDAEIAFAMHMITYRTSIFKRFDYRQTEGVSYTDNEWRIIPMAVVRKAYAITAKVYLYLVGRNGQTMNPDVFAANLHVMLQLTQGMVAKCAELVKSGIVLGRYVRYCVQDSVDMIYLAALCGWKNYPTKLDIKGFDDAIREFGGEFYSKARKRQIKFVRFPMSLLSFYPVKVWDRWHTTKAPRLVLHKAFKKIGKIFH